MYFSDSLKNIYIYRVKCSGQYPDIKNWASVMSGNL